MTWLTATEALRVLHVRPQTLYANVSRKKIRAKPDPKDTRRSLYHEVDVRKLARKQGGRRKATVVAAGAIEWGDPVLSSSISTVVDGRLYYRGKDAVGLSETATLEGAAGLLWGAEAVDFERAWREGSATFVTGLDGRRIGRATPTAVKFGAGAGAGGGPCESVDSTRGKASVSPLQRAFCALGQRAGADLSSYGRALPVLQAEAAGVLVTLASALLDPEGLLRAGWRSSPVPRLSPEGRKGRSEVHLERVGKRLRGSVVLRSEGPGRYGESSAAHPVVALHERVADAFGCRSAGDILRRVLILLADHELNASTFATRVAVSTGAPLSAGVLSGLATLSGPLHGRAALGVLELLASVERLGADVAVRDRLSQGRPIVGFGHPLYPEGDPRAAALLRQIALPRAYAELSGVVEDRIGERPNIDFALAALTKVQRLPPEAPLILFALGRCVGWLAHALEQVTTGHPIRPRARYVGPPVS
jgi:citrate synthase